MGDLRKSSRVACDVTVITPAIEERWRYGTPSMLEQCVASVLGQTWRPVAHYIGLDLAQRYNAKVQNDLACGVETEYLVILADDDYLFPTFLETLVPIAEDTRADIVYPYADLSGWPEGSPQRRVINQPWDAHRIQATNWIPGGCCLIRRSAWERVGGCSERRAHRHDHDWRFIREVANTGGTVVCHPEELWHYRCHPAQMQAEVDGRTA